MDKKTFSVSVITVFVQYYDYHLFGFLAAKIANHFFSDTEVIIQLLNTYLIMAIGMIAKPLGAVIFGKIGDSKGRSNSFSLSLIGTTIASFILFITPSNESIGLASAFILLICRMVICSFASSGSDGVRIYIYEHIDRNKQSLGVGITALFTLCGTLAASISSWAFTLDNFPPYSWKFAFLVGILMGLFTLITIKISGLKDTVKVSEANAFNDFKSLPMKEIIQRNWKLFLLCTILTGGIGSTNQFVIIFFGTYNFEILKNIEHSLMQQYTSIAIIVYMVFAVIGGYFADKVGNYKITIFAAVLTIIFAFSLSFLLNYNQMSPVFYFLIVASLATINIPAAVILKQSIPMAIRYRIFSLSHAIGSIVLSAPTAFISTLLYRKTNIAWIPIAYFIIIILIISLVLYNLNSKLKLAS